MARRLRHRRRRVVCRHWPDVRRGNGPVRTLAHCLRFAGSLPACAPLAWSALVRARRGLVLDDPGRFRAACLGATALLLPVALNACRSRRYAYALALAFIAGAPFMLIWPIWLAYHAWPLF